MGKEVQAANQLTSRLSVGIIVVVFVFALLLHGPVLWAANVCKARKVEGRKNQKRTHQE